MGDAMRASDLRRELIASIQREQLQAANIISDLTFDPRLSAKELMQELERSKLRRSSLAYTEENLIITGATR